ncbi:MAG TPA: hypothetical protein PK777_12395 [Thermoguttaceae bacterium]|nr:hypothetical protein [Thermoguttaceae bacterium]HPP53744.1 hypothetical protein [Thermoguttaceae bacterium]
MWHEYYRQAERWITHLDTRDWVWVFLAAVIIGLVCMRGLGGRLS